MKLEAITPFLGKYRPFVGRCCQTCTPKSWVSDGRARPQPGSLVLGAEALGSCFLYALPGLALPCPMPLPLSCRGRGALGLVVWLGCGLFPGLGELGGRSAEGPKCGRVCPGGWGLIMPV